MQHIFIFIAVFFTANFHAIGASSLLYHQDKKAQKIEGSIKALSSAIRSGKTIRIYMNLGFVEHSMDAGFVSIIGDKVYAQINEIQAQIPNRERQTIQLRPYAVHVGLYSTQSNYEMKWYSLD